MHSHCATQHMCTLKDQIKLMEEPNAHCDHDVITKARPILIPCEHKSVLVIHVFVWSTILSVVM